MSLALQHVRPWPSSGGDSCTLFNSCMSSSSFLWLNCLHRQNDCFLTMLCMCMYVIYSGRDDTSQVLKRNMSKILYYNWLVFISWTIPLCEKYKRLMWKIGNFKFSCQNIKCRKNKNNSYLIPFHFAIVKVSLSQYCVQGVAYFPRVIDMKMWAYWLIVSVPIINDTFIILYVVAPMK